MERNAALLGAQRLVLTVLDLFVDTTWPIILPSVYMIVGLGDGIARGRRLTSWLPRSLIRLQIHKGKPVLATHVMVPW